jgi:hypothetical protein
LIRAQPSSPRASMVLARGHSSTCFCSTWRTPAPRVHRPPMQIRTESCSSGSLLYKMVCWWRIGRERRRG